MAQINANEKPVDAGMQLVETFLRTASVRKMDDFMFSLDFDLFGADNDPKFFEQTTNKVLNPFMRSFLVESSMRRIDDAGVKDRAVRCVTLVNRIEKWSIGQLVDFANSLQCGVRRKDGRPFADDDKTRSTLMYTLSRHLGRRDNWSEAEPFLAKHDLLVSSVQNCQNVAQNVSHAGSDSPIVPDSPIVR